jgi:hypothetical protein
MCFSANADLVGGAVLTVIGIDALRHVHRRGDKLALAALPLVLALHQLDEAFVWWGLEGHIAPGAGQAALWVYLVVAFVVLPVYLPLAVLALEPAGRRRNAMTGFLGLGVAVSTVLLAAMVRGPVTVTLGDRHLIYGIGVPALVLVVGLYIVATCGPLVLSGYRWLARFGALNLAAVALLAHLAISGFPSLWCGWAAVSAGVIALHLRYAGPHRSVVAALS